MFYLYIYKKDGTPITQTESIKVSNVQRKINNIGSCDFTLQLSDDIVKTEVFAKGNIFDVFSIENGEEKRLIKGIVRKIKINQNNIEVKIEDLLYVLKRRFLRVDKTYTSQTFQYILEDLFSYINGISTTLTSISCDITTITSETFKKGISLYKILQDLSENGYEFKIENQTVIFKELCGIDRTQNNDDYYEYIYDFNEPYGRNINNIELNDDLDDFANGVIDKTSAEDDIGTDEILLEDYISDDISKIDYIAEHKVFIGDYGVEIAGQDFFQTDIGDKVAVYIYSGNELLFYDGSMKVVEKTMNVSIMKQIQIKLSKNKVNIKEFLEQFEELKLKIGKLET